MYCSANQAKYPNNTHLNSYCEKNKFLDDPNYHTNYHVKELLQGNLHQGFYVDPKDIINEQINFVEKLEEIKHDNKSFIL